MFAFLRIERPMMQTLRPSPTATSTACCMRCTFDAKDETRMRPSRSGKIWRNASPTIRSDGVKPGRSAFVEAADVRLQTVNRRVVELVVARMHDAAGGRLEHDRNGVGDRMRHPHELD